MRSALFHRTTHHQSFKACGNHHAAVQRRTTVWFHVPFDGTGPGEVARYVHFLAAEPGPDAAEALDAAGSAAEAFALGDGVVYSRLRKDELGPGVFSDVERVLGVPATRRTWTVVRRVAELAAAD